MEPIFAADVIEWASGWALVLIAVGGGVVTLAVRSIFVRDKFKAHEEALFGDRDKHKNGIVETVSTMQELVSSLNDAIFGNDDKKILGIKEIVTTIHEQIKDVAKVMSQFQDLQQEMGKVTPLVIGDPASGTEGCVLRHRKIEADMAQSALKIHEVEEVTTANQNFVNLSLMRIEGLLEILSTKIDQALHVPHEPLPTLTPPHGLPTSVGETSRHNKTIPPGGFDPKHGKGR